MSPPLRISETKTKNTINMTENDGKDRRSVIVLAGALGVALFIVAFVVSVVVFPLFISAFPEVVFFLSDTSEDNDQLFCSMEGPYSKATEYNRYMQDEWLISDNISSYEDIPESQKSNLSEEAQEWLNTSDQSIRVYNPVKYNDLSGEEQELFRRAINTTTSFREEPDFDYVFYDRSMYHCRITTPQPGT